MTPEASLRRTLVLLGGVAALLAALFAAMQVDASRKSSRAANEASRLAVRIVEETTSSGLRLNLYAAATREREELALRAMALKSFAGGSGLGAVATADWEAGQRLGQALEATVGKPLELTTFSAEQAALEQRAEAMLARQAAALAQSERSGRRSNAAARGLLLVAMAGALLTLAGSLTGRPALLAVGTSVLVLGAAVATAALGLVT
jgi:hypothetical protein